MSGSEGSTARLRHSIGDLVRSMAVVLAVVAALLLVTWRPQPDPVRTVDPQPIRLLAEAQAGFPILVPEGMQVTSVRWEPTSATDDIPVWHVGGVTDSGAYLQVSQARLASPAFIAEQAGDGTAIGSIEIDGVTWTSLEGENGRALASTVGGVTTVLYGTVDWAELESLAGRASALS